MKRAPVWRDGMYARLDVDLCHLADAVAVGPAAFDMTPKACSIPPSLHRSTRNTLRPACPTQIETTASRSQKCQKYLI